MHPNAPRPAKSVCLSHRTEQTVGRAHGKVDGKKQACSEQCAAARLRGVGKIARQKFRNLLRHKTRKPVKDAVRIKVEKAEQTAHKHKQWKKREDQIVRQSRAVAPDTVVKIAAQQFACRALKRFPCPPPHEAPPLSLISAAVQFKTLYIITQNAQ